MFEIQPEPGENVVLTIDLDIQRAAEKSLAEHRGADARGGNRRHGRAQRRRAGDGFVAGDQSDDLCVEQSGLFG